MAATTRQEKLQQDIIFAQNRLATKEAYIPQLLANCKDATMIQKYRDGMMHERQLIVKWTMQLSG